MRLFVGHAESPWMPWGRFIFRWFCVGQALGLTFFVIYHAFRA